MRKDAYQLHPRMPFCEAAPLAITTRLETLFAHEQGTRAGDAEALHDMRVASRRLRAAMSIFASCFPKQVFKPLRKETARCTSALGAVRDTDVMLDAVRQLRDDLTAEEVYGIDSVIGALSAERDVQRQRMLDTLDEVARADYRQRLQAALWGARFPRGSHKRHQETLGEAARRISARGLADLYGFVPYIHDPARADELHDLRKAAKRLRYRLEIFQACFGPDIDDRIEDIKSMQDQIGKIHDCDVLIDLLRDHLATLVRRDHERLLALALEQQTPARRRKRVRDAIEAYNASDPRPGLLALLGRIREERERRHADFVRWWDEQDAAGLRDTLYACIAAAHAAHATHSG